MFDLKKKKKGKEKSPKVKKDEHTRTLSNQSNARGNLSIVLPLSCIVLIKLSKC